VSKVSLQRFRQRIIVAWHRLKKAPSVDTIVDARLNEIPAKHVSRIKRRLAHKRAMQGK
jgi:hypothetical protein